MTPRSFCNGTTGDPFAVSMPRVRLGFRELAPNCHMLLASYHFIGRRSAATATDGVIILHNNHRDGLFDPHKQASKPITRGII